MRFAIVVAAALLGCGCGPAAGVPPPRAPVSAPPATRLRAFEGSTLGEFRSMRFGLRLPLPDGHGWRIDDRKTPWLTATHAATGSTILVRRWYEEDRVNRVRCEARARGMRALPEREGSDLLEERAVNVPPDFDTALEVRIVAPQEGDSVRGFAMAFGGWVHTCFAYVFTTTAEGPGAEAALGDRLAAMTQSSLAGITMDDPRHPFERGQVPVLPDESPTRP
jgi:hypothetical protein